MVKNYWKGYSQPKRRGEERKWNCYKENQIFQNKLENALKKIHHKNGTHNFFSVMNFLSAHS